MCQALGAGILEAALPRDPLLPKLLIGTKSQREEGTSPSLSHSHWCWSLALKFSPRPQEEIRVVCPSGISFQEGAGWLPGAGGGGRYWRGCSALGLAGRDWTPLAMGPALLPVLPEVSQWTHPAPPPLRIGSAGMWSLAELSTHSVLSPWVPGPRLSATSWDLGGREDRKESMLCFYCVPSPGVRTQRFAHPLPHVQRVSNSLQIQAGKRRPREGKGFARP